MLDGSPGNTNRSNIHAKTSQAAVQEQANKLFACISEANTVLSDPARRGEVHILKPSVS
jgi:curved DNA-binding protein CbpA